MEGRIIYGIDRWFSSHEDKAKLEDAVHGVPQLTSGALRETYQTLSDATDRLVKLFDLAYHDQQLESQNQVVQQFFEQVRGEAMRSVRGSRRVLNSALLRLCGPFGASYSAIYLGEELRASSEIVFEPFAASEAVRDRTPRQLSIPSGSIVLGPSSGTELQATLVGAVPPAPDFYYVDWVDDAAYCLFLFCRGTPVDQGDNLYKSLERVGRHVADILRSAYLFDEAVEGRERVELIADSTRHELNAPLQGIRGAAGRLRSLLDRQGSDRQHIHDAALRIDNFAREASRVVDRLSRASLTSAGDANVRRLSLAAANLGKVIRRTSAPFSLSAQERGVSIRVTPSIDDLPKVECDAQQMEVLFANLIDNAVKFSHANHSVDIEGERTRLHVGPGTVLREAVRITISDFGLGVPEEDLDRIFDKYTQSSLADVRRSIGGTGLGLYVCREIVARHHGRIFAASKTPFWKLHGAAADQEDLLLQGVRVDFSVIVPLSQEGL